MARLGARFALREFDSEAVDVWLRGSAVSEGALLVLIAGPTITQVSAARSRFVVRSRLEPSLSAPMRPVASTASTASNATEKMLCEHRISTRIVLYEHSPFVARGASLEALDAVLER